MMDQTVYVLRKGHDEEVRLSIRKYQGRQFFDIRVFVEKPSGHLEFTATQKGVCLDAYTFSEFKKGVMALEQELVRRGLLEPGK